ncbi:hypothetical protein [Hymenobacter guriensis]|uniref:WG repeat-containing protein n=1 Tax=Hymenobacter guriensis TaxID=2793065 RepID=A0ABS0L727_9BACT|nr:hypothetical protein [Hymenobacter guriensis]MBG8555954.1 hypothetical protein [Hymenobacter guriensis]
MSTRWLFTLLLWGQVLSSNCQDFAQASFREMSLSTVTSAASLAKLNYAPGYTVRNIAGKLVVRKSHEQFLTQLQTPDGTFIGQNLGEWGGQLMFQPNTRQSKPVLLKKGNIRLIFQINGRVYFIEGLSHGGVTTGALYQLTRKLPTFTWTRLTDFEDSPEAFAIVDNDVYIVQSHGFMVLRNLQKEMVLEKAFWSGLYPNSVAVFSDGEVCIGMRGGYVRLNTKTKVLRFFQHMP